MGKQTGFYCALAFIAGFLLAYLMSSPSPNYVNDIYEGLNCSGTCSSDAISNLKKGYYKGTMVSDSKRGFQLPAGAHLHGLEGLQLYAHIDDNHKLANLLLGYNTAQGLSMSCEHWNNWDCLKAKAELTGTAAMNKNDADLLWNDRRHTLDLSCGRAVGGGGIPRITLNSVTNNDAFCLSIYHTAEGMSGTVDYNFKFVSENKPVNANNTLD
tara:strand:- start:7255 stop:7890 length:636 start_codon:yes stop_codon:yes gene_type:complete